MASSDNYEDDFDTDTTDTEADNKHKGGRHQVPLKEIVNDLGSTEHLLNINKSAIRMNSKNKGQRGVANRRSSLPKVNEGSSKGSDASKKIEAYKRANERLRGELDKCIDSQYRVRELEDQLKNKRDEMKKLAAENGRLEKMLEKPVKDVVEVDNGHMDKIRVLTNDLRLLQDKTRKYKSRALDAERSVQRLTVQLGELQSKNDKLLVLLKEVKKDGMNSKDRTDMENAVARNEQKAQVLSRELQLCKKKHASDLKKFRVESHAANMEVERLREKAERSEGVLKEVQMEARILSLKLRNEHRGKPKHKIKLGLVEHIIEAKSEPSRSATHRSVETASTKEQDEYSGLSFLEKSILADLPTARRKELALKLSPRGDVPEVSPERVQLQDKMESLRLKQAEVAQQEAAKEARRQSEAKRLVEPEAEQEPDDYEGMTYLEKSIVPVNVSTNEPSTARSAAGSSNGKPLQAVSVAGSQDERSPAASIAQSGGSPVSSAAASQCAESPTASVAASQGEPSPGRGVVETEGLVLNTREPASDHRSGEHTQRSVVAGEVPAPIEAPDEQEAVFVNDTFEESVDDPGYTDDEFDLETPQRSVAPTPVPPEFESSDSPAEMPVVTESSAPDATLDDDLQPVPPEGPAPIARKVSMPSKPNFGGAKKKKW